MRRIAPRIVIVHDYLGQYGGAERVALEMARAFPGAPIYTSYYAPHQTFPDFEDLDVRTTFLDNAPAIDRFYRAYLPLYPAAFRLLRLPECDVVLSSSSAFAKGVRVPDGARHVCYCHAPMRFAWDLDTYMAHESPALRTARWLLKPLVAGLQRWDVDTNRNVDLFIVNSRNIAGQIIRRYGREPRVIHPPVDLQDLRPCEQSADYYLVVSRLSAYKRVDLAVEACTSLGARLKIVGDGPDRPRLESLAGESVEFLGRVVGDELADLYAKCRALLFCGEEDFGITPLEAMASGRPVIAFRGGGALETVREGETGSFFDEQKPAAVIDAIQEFEKQDWLPAVCRSRAEQFSREQFHRRMRGAVSDVLSMNEGEQPGRSAR